MTSHAINPSVYAKMPYDTERDLIPVSFVASVPNVVVAHPSLGFNFKLTNLQAAVAMGQLRYLEDCGVDAVIVQDLGLARMVKALTPRLRPMTLDQSYSMLPIFRPNSAARWVRVW